MAAAAGSGAKSSPVGCRPLLKLTDLGIAPGEIKFKNVTLQSGKYVCIREEAQGRLAVVTVGSKEVLRLPIKVDSAIMNPVSRVVALRAGDNLQIYNLEMKARMKATELEGVVFWRWLDPKTIAVVTGDAVYHWSMEEGKGEPTKMFDRAEEGQVQIINYASSADGKWLLLGGIAANPAGGIRGVLQVYSVDVGASQPTMNAHAGTFAHITLDGRDSPSQLFCFTQVGEQGAKLAVYEVGVDRSVAFRQTSAIQFQANDFPVAMQADNKHGVLFLISKRGMLYMYEIQSGKRIFAHQASRVTMFASCVYEENGGSGIGTIDQMGAVSNFFVEEKNLVPFICNEMQDYELGVSMAKRYNLPGADGIFVKQFARLMQQQKYTEAIELAASSPQGSLRNANTISQFRNAQAPPGQKAILLQYFSLLLQRGRLNAVEAYELSNAVLAKGGAAVKHVEGWLKEDKLEPSEDLGDLLKNHEMNLALSVYVRAKVPEKVIGCFLAMGAREADRDAALAHFQKIFAYAKQSGFQPDYPLLVQQLLRFNGDRAKDFGLMLIRNESGPIVGIETLVNAFLQAQDVKNCTNIMLEYLRTRGDLEEDGPLQTQVLEINLMSAQPQVADAILESEEYKFSHYDRIKIAQLCERAQLYQRALEHYKDLEDIKRVLANTHALNPEFLLEFFGKMTPENCLECLRDLLRYNMQQNIRLVVSVAKKWSDYLTPEKLVALFEEFNSWNGLYFYLGAFVNFTEDPSVVFKYVQAGVKLQQLREVERVCRDNEHYDAKEVKAFLLEQNLKDPRPLIYVCDRHDFVDELTQHLYTNNMFPFIEAYVQRMNGKAAPAVVSALLDLNAGEEQIRNLISSVRPPIDDPTFIERLVAGAEKRNRLLILRPWLEARLAENNEDVHLHNGLAKIYVDSNSNPAQFLSSNKFYDSAEVGKYCESRDPHLAFVAYRRAWGACDAQLIEVTNKNGFFKDQARYLVERQDLDLWEGVLTEENEHRRQLIDQVVATALPESKVPEEVSTTVKAFMAANLPNELIELLERIILHGPADGAFHKNKNLQNLLILTAIKADTQRVMDYINRLDNYDGPDIAKIAISDQYELFEEGFFIYKKFKCGPEAIGVLLNNLESIERATEFAEYWDQAEVWSILAKAQLEQGLVPEAIAAYLKADDAGDYVNVIHAAKRAEQFDKLIEYLTMARKHNREPVIDNELIYSYARTDRLADMEEFISQPNVAKLEQVGDACYAQGLYQAGRVLFTSINNNAKLALCLVNLDLYAEAVEAARAANAIPTWKAVCFACVDAKQFRLAQACGVHIIVYNEHLLDLLAHYERKAYFAEVIAVLEQGVNLERAHQGIYTQLGVLYAKYREEKLMEHIKLFWSRLNIPQLLQACKVNLHWREAVFLYTHYDQFDNAVDVMMEHSTSCWTNDWFKEIVAKVNNSEVYYKAVRFYLAEHPLLLNDLLLDVAHAVDHARVVDLVRTAGHLPLIQKYILHVQRENITRVNEAVNDLCLEEEDHKALRESIDAYESFDPVALAQRVEGHELVEFRRIAAYLYKRAKPRPRWEKSLNLSKNDELWQDAMETAAQSQDRELAESLLRFFVEKDQHECFAACLFACYELIRPDVVLELSWREGLMDFAMPFMVQSFREYDDKLNAVSKRLEDEAAKSAEKDDEAAAQAEQQAQQQAHGLMGPNGGFYPQPIAIMPPPGVGYPPQGGGGYPM